METKRSGLYRESPIIFFNFSMPKFENTLVNLQYYAYVSNKDQYLLKN
jgi:hypothetical protein